MTYCVSCLLHYSITITARVKCVCTSTMAICKQYSAGEVGRLSKHEIYWAFSGRIHFYEFPYNTYISWPLFNAVKCSITSTERVVNGSCVYKPLLVEVLYTPDFSAYIAEKAAVGISVSNSWIYTYSTR